jgi:hypothetical protein
MGGGGGEYVPQKGFGWSNGVALYLLNYTGVEINVIDDVDGDGDTDNTDILLIIVITFLCFAILFFFIYKYYKTPATNVKIEDNVPLARVGSSNSLRSHLI